MSRSYQILLAVCAIAAIVPLFCARHLPMGDLPEHLAAIATIRHYSDPAWRSQEYFALLSALETPYWLYHLVGALLTPITGSAERANLVLLALVGLAYPYSLRALLAALRRDERLALFGCMLFWSNNLTVGLLNFVASVPVVVFGLALVVRQAESPTLRRAFGLGAVSVAILYLHLSSFVLFALEACVLTAVVRAPDPTRVRGELLARIRAMPRQLVWIVPSAAGAVFILRAGRAGASGSAEEHNIEFAPRLELLRRIPDWVFDAFQTRIDDIIGWVVLALLVGLVLFSKRAASFEERWRTWTAALVAVLALAFYLALPSRIGSYAFLLDVRMSVFVVLFAVLLPRPREGARGGAPLVAAAALSLVLSANAAHSVYAFERDEVGHFDDLLQKMPRGERLLYLNFQPHSAHVKAGGVFSFFGSYYRARSGGIAAYSFSDMPHWPIQYRSAWRPPTNTNWHDPCSFRNTREGTFYDFVLTHGNVEPFASHPPGPAWEMIGGSRAFRLYRKVDAQWPAVAADRGPCS